MAAKAHQASLAKKYKKGCKVNQIKTDSANGVGSQNFEASLDAYDDTAVDDFKCASKKKKVNISKVIAYGQITAVQPTSFNVSIYEWDDSTPVGKTVCSGTNLNATNVPATPGTTKYTISGLSGCTLHKNSMYWLDVQANLNFTGGGQWYWEMLTPSTNDPSYWQNPGGGFGVCPTWGTLSDCVTLDGVSYDLAFQI